MRVVGLGLWWGAGLLGMCMFRAYHHRSKNPVPPLTWGELIFGFLATWGGPVTLVIGLACCTENDVPLHRGFAWLSKPVWWK